MRVILVSFSLMITVWCSAGSAVFPTVDSAIVAKQIEERVVSPWLVNQSGIDLCGPALVCYFMAKYRPESYREMVWGLYMRGECMPAKRRIRVSQAMTEEGVVDGIMSRMPGMAFVDFLTMGALRHTENDGICRGNYSPIDASLFYDGTWPMEVREFIVKYGGLKVTRQRYWFPERLKVFREAREEHQEVVLLINNGWDGPFPGVWGVTGWHYIIANGDYQEKGDRVLFEYWDYGSLWDGSGERKYHIASRKRWHRSVKGYWVVKCPKERRDYYHGGSSIPN